MIRNYTAASFQEPLRTSALFGNRAQHQITVAFDNPRLKVELLTRPEIIDAIDARRLHRHANLRLYGSTGVAALQMVGAQLQVQVKHRELYIEFRTEPQIEEIAQQLRHAAPNKCKIRRNRQRQKPANAPISRTNT